MGVLVPGETMEHQGAAMETTGMGELKLAAGLRPHAPVLAWRGMSSASEPDAVAAPVTPAPLLRNCCACAGVMSSSNEASMPGTVPCMAHCWVTFGGVLSSCSLWAKKQMLRVQASPELHIVVRYLRNTKAAGGSALSSHCRREQEGCSAP